MLLKDKLEPYRLLLASQSPRRRELMTGCGLPYEFRTTVVKQLHSREDILSIGRWLAGSRAYFLQSYQDSDAVLRPGYSAHSRETLKEFLSLVKPFIPSASLRGID